MEGRLGKGRRGEDWGESSVPKKQQSREGKTNLIPSWKDEKLTVIAKKKERGK